LKGEIHELERVVATMGRVTGIVTSFQMISNISPVQAAFAWLYEPLQ
jgi:hypothetical protein